MTLTPSLLIRPLGLPEVCVCPILSEIDPYLLSSLFHSLIETNFIQYTMKYVA